MFHPVPFFGAFGVVEAVKGSDEIASNAPGALKAYALAYCAAFLGHIVQLCKMVFALVV